MEAKLTPLFLKTVSCKFDLETVFMLDLKEKNVQGGVGSIGECTNLLHLDLSRNRITMLSGMDNCINLKILDLSYNRLSTIDPVKGCVLLEKLWLQGNQIKDMQSLTRTAPPLEKLRLLYLQEFNGEGANECCKAKGYRLNVLKLFPNLDSLDGQRTKLPAHIDMGKLGLDGDDNEEELDYDLEG